MYMIDKDAVLNMIDINIEPHTHGAWDSGYNVALSEMREKIKQMLAVEAESDNDWISVDDRLPEKSGRYLVHTSCIANYRPLKDNVFVAGFVNRDWVFEGWESNLVTHWQHLPEPPKGE